jgi:predicted permease
LYQLQQVLSLALPFFGLILLGFLCGKLVRYPEAGLQWMNFFIVYIALPCLFFKLVLAAPFEQLSNWRFVIATTAATGLMFVLAFSVGMVATKGNIRASAVQAVAGAYANIGYMGPGLTLAALGPNAVVPTALIFVFDNMLHFSAIPFLMAVGNKSSLNFGETVLYVVKRVVSHPFNISIAAAVLAASVGFQPPQALDTILIYLKNAAAPCALFTLGVTVALRPFQGSSPELPWLLAIKLVLHPIAAWIIVSAIGDFGREWTLTAVLMAALPPALNVFVIANQYNVYVERASSAILAGTTLSVFTVTGLLYLIAENHLPYRFPLFLP